MAGSLKIDLKQSMKRFQQKVHSENIDVHCYFGLKSHDYDKFQGGQSYQYS
jgi:hypothetical protein